jgi:hypothetical protein
MFKAQCPTFNVQCSMLNAQCSIIGQGIPWPALPRQYAHRQPADKPPLYEPPRRLQEKDD